MTSIFLLEMLDASVVVNSGVTPVVDDMLDKAKRIRRSRKGASARVQRSCGPSIELPHPRDVIAFNPLSASVFPKHVEVRPRKGNETKMLLHETA